MHYASGNHMRPVLCRFLMRLAPAQYEITQHVDKFSAARSEVTTMRT